MAEVDPIILQLRADVQKYRAELLTTTNMVDAALGRQERAVVDLERQIRQSSGQIAGHLRGLAGAFAGYFSAQQFRTLIDGYTRVQNSLRVAGLEGEGLADVQQRLLDLSTRYGVSLESLAELFGSATQAGTDLGANQAQILALTEATSRALKISGTSATQASGAILGLTQALASGVVRAEEFNQINEGGLRPLLQLVANTEKYGGSVGKLRIAVADGKVTSEEFFSAILKGADALDKRAAKATLTLSGAFEALKSALTVYVGEASAANGATATLSQAILLLANNLDALATAAAVLATILAGRLVGGLAASASASIAATAAAAGATTAFGAMAASARAAGVSMLAALGGPVGVATALGIAIVALVQAQDDSTASSRAQAAALEEVEGATEPARDAIDKLATATGKARAEAIEHAKALRAQTKDMIDNARAAAQAARVKLQAAKAELASRSTLITGISALSTLAGGPVGIAGEGKVTEAQANYDAAMAKVGALIDSFDKLGAAISAPPSTLRSSATEEKKDKKKPRGASGPTAAEIEQKHLDEVRRLQAEQLQDELAVTDDLDRRREILLELNRLEYEQRRAQIENDKNFTTPQKAAQLKLLEARFGPSRTVDGEIVLDKPTFLGRAINREVEEREARNRAQVARDEQEALQAEAELADTRLARLAIERAILEQREIEEEAALEAAIASGQVADAVKARAALERKQAARREGVERDNESPIEAYRRRLENRGKNIDDEVETLVVQRLDEVDDAIANTIADRMGVKDPLIKQLLALLLEQILIRPIVDALADSKGGVGGILSGIGKAVGSLFGRSSGGYVGPGQTVRVNEHKGGVELLRMGSQGGHVVPLGQANARAARPASQTIVKQTFVLDNRYGITTPQLLERVNDIARREAAAAGSASYEQAMKDAPNAVTQARRFGSRAY